MSLNQLVMLSLGVSLGYAGSYFAGDSNSMNAELSKSGYSHQEFAECEQQILQCGIDIAKEQEKNRELSARIRMAGTISAAHDNRTDRAVARQDTEQKNRTAEASAESDEYGESATIGALVDALEKVMDSGDGILDPRATEAIYARLRNDASAATHLLAEYIEVAGSSVGDALGLLLGEVDDPRIETAALDLINSVGDRPRRLAGLKLLRNIRDPSGPSGVRAIAEIVRTEYDPEILSAALLALKFHASEPETVANVMMDIEALLSHENETVRASSVWALSQGAVDAETMNPVVKALSDPSVTVRMQASLGIGQARVTSREMLNALAKRVSDVSEDRAVRELAWHTLKKFPMEAEAYDVYKSFEEEVGRMQ